MYKKNLSRQINAHRTPRIYWEVEYIRLQASGIYKGIYKIANVFFAINVCSINAIKKPLASLLMSSGELNEKREG